MTTIGISPRTPGERVVPSSRLAANMAGLLAQRGDELERQIDELRSHARAACPDPDGAHLDQWHEFFDIDPDLRGRDYSQTGGAR